MTTQTEVTNRQPRTTKGQKQPNRRPSYRNEELGKPEVVKILAAAKRLGLQPHELAEMAGLERWLFRKMEAKWKAGKHNYCPRIKTLEVLNKTLKDLRVQKKQEENAPKQEELKLVALTQEDIDELNTKPELNEEEWDKLTHMREKKEKALRNVTNPIMYKQEVFQHSERQTAAQVIRNMIDERLNNMTFLELALMLAHVMEKK